MTDRSTCPPSPFMKGLLTDPLCALKKRGGGHIDQSHHMNQKEEGGVEGMLTATLF